MSAKENTVGLEEAKLQHGLDARQVGQPIRPRRKGEVSFSLLECGLGVVRAAGSRLPLRSPLRSHYAGALLFEIVNEK